MLDKEMSRRKFLVGAGALATAVAVGGVGFAGRVSDARAEGSAVPWPYPTDPAQQPDPDALARRAYELYYLQGGCAEATWWPIIEALAAKAGSDATYVPWTTLPKKIFAYGGGGVAGWGTLCGTCNGSSAIVGMVVSAAADRNKIIDEVMQYYGETPLPTNGIDRAVAAGWSPTTGVPAPLANVPTSTAHSQLCHASLSQWTMTTGAADGSTQQKDRCGKACHDMTLKTVRLLNAYFANNAKALPAGVLDPSIATCQSGCHSSAKGKMACDACHDEAPGQHGF